MKNKLKGLQGFDQTEQDGGIASLLKSIRDLSNKIEENVSPYETMDDLHKQFFLYRQMPGEDNSTHLARFKELVDMLKHNGSTILHDKALVDHEMRQAGSTKEDERAIYVKIARDKHLAVCFLRRANQGVYAPLLRELCDQRLHGIDLYPKDIADAYTLLENHSSRRRRSNYNSDYTGGRSDVGEGIQRAQRGERGVPSRPAVAGLDGRFIRNRQCFTCYRYGHYSDQCPNAEDTITGTQLHMHGAVIEEVQENKEEQEELDNSVDFLYVQGVPLLHSVSGTSYQFRALEPIHENRANKQDISLGIKHILDTYRSRNINIK